MTPGREMDKMIAEDVLGFDVKKNDMSHDFSMKSPIGTTAHETMRLPQYSMDPDVLGEVKQKFPNMTVQKSVTGGWTCSWDGDPASAVTEATEAHAICKAALKSIGK